MTCRNSLKIFKNFETSLNFFHLLLEDKQTFKLDHSKRFHGYMNAGFLDEGKVLLLFYDLNFVTTDKIAYYSPYYTGWECFFSEEKHSPNNIV